MGLNLHSIRIIGILLIFNLSVSFINVTSTNGGNISEINPISIIIDTDGGTDDFLAILYLLQDPVVTVKAITVSNGVTYVESGVNNILRLLDYLDINDIPVAGGQDKPLIVDHGFPAAWREGSNSFYGVVLPETTVQPSKLNATGLIISEILSSSENITIVAFGPLTNVAQVLERKPEVKNRIDAIHMMGGAVTVDGNVGFEYPDIPNFTAEWNIYIDPDAADIVFKSKLPLFLIPLDSTNDVPQTIEYLQEFENAKKTVVADLALQFFNPGLFFWDALAAVVLTNPNIVDWSEFYIEIEIDLENHEGQTKSISDKGTNTLVATNADRDLFEQILMDTLNLGEVIFHNGMTEISEEEDTPFIRTLSITSILIVLVLRYSKSKRL